MGGALHALPTAVVVVVQPFHHVSVWLLRCDLGPLVGFLVASDSLVRWASPYFDDDSRPGLVQHIDVLSHLECVMLSFPKSRGKYGTQEFGSSVAWYCRIRRQLELSILHPDYINSPRILFSYLWFGSRCRQWRQRSKRGDETGCLMALLRLAPAVHAFYNWLGCRVLLHISLSHPDPPPLGAHLLTPYCPAPTPLARILNCHPLQTYVGDRASYRLIIIAMNHPHENLVLKVKWRPAKMPEVKHFVTTSS